MARRRNRFYREAELDALVRYGPEISGLLELERQARQTLRSGVRSARGNARGIIAETRRAEPEVRDIYDDASQAHGLATAQIAAHTAELGPVADSVSAAVGGEAANAGTRIAEARAASLNELASRRVSAREGKQFAVQNARSQFAEDIGQILRRRQSLRGEVGAFTAATAGDLREDARDRRLRLRLERIQQRGQNRRQGASLSQSERNSIRSSGIDPDTGKPIPGGKADPKARPKLTPLQQSRAADTIADAVNWAQKLATAGLDFQTAKKALSEGRDEVKPEHLHDPVTGKPLYNPDGTPKLSKGRSELPKFDSQLLLQAALEVAYNGHISKATRAKLRRRGLQPRLLNIPLPKQSDTGAVRPQTGTQS